MKAQIKQIWRRWTSSEMKLTIDHQNGVIGVVVGILEYALKLGIFIAFLLVIGWSIHTIIELIV